LSFERKGLARDATECKAVWLDKALRHSFATPSSEALTNCRSLFASVPAPASKIAPFRSMTYLNSWVGQACLLGFLLAQNVSHALLIQISRSVPPSERYFTSTAVLMGEVFKFFGSLGCVLFTTNFRSVWQFFSTAKSWRNSWTLIFPAVVYTVQNNLSFIALNYIPATEFQLLAQAKTLTTALFSVIFLGTRLSRIQWMALTLLVIGMNISHINSR
jgi:UDP-sugar transporter A1/2/3